MRIWPFGRGDRGRRLRLPWRARDREAAPDAGQRRLFAVAGLAVVGFLVFFPGRQILDQRARAARLEARLVDLDNANAELEREVARLSDPEELELMARKRLGLARPGERVYVFEPAPTPTPTPASDPGRLSRTWTWLVELVRGNS